MQARKECPQCYTKKKGLPPLCSVYFMYEDMFTGVLSFLYYTTFE